jgi:hypothetical protein
MATYLPRHQIIRHELLVILAIRQFQRTGGRPLSLGSHDMKSSLRIFSGFGYLRKTQEDREMTMGDATQRVAGFPSSLEGVGIAVAARLG